jgi:hypothetical protein
VVLHVYAAYETQGERVIPMLGVIFAVSLRLKVIAKKTDDGEVYILLGTAVFDDMIFSRYRSNSLSF